MKNGLSILLVFCLILFFSCQNNRNSNDLKLMYLVADKEAQAVSPEFIRANDAFAVKLLKTVSSGETGKNMMISPLSVSIALSMVLNGASGDNLAEMKTVLGFDSMELDALNREFSHLIKSLESADQDIILANADSVWMRDSFAPRVYKSFLDALADYYEAEAYSLDFSDPAAVDTINSWVSGHTMKKIDTIISEIKPETVMYLINAIYFKAAWTTMFDKDSTSDGTFTLTGGVEKTVKLMSFNKDQEFSFFSSADGSENGYSAVRLPYGRDKIAFYGFIPHSGTIDQFIKNLPDTGLEDLFLNLEKKEIPVILPKFRFEYEKSLVDTLKSLGMIKAFDTGGLLDIASDGEGLFISEVKHKTFIEVSEEGTEAAAVTSVEIGETCMPDGFFATKPFAFVIRDDRSGAILFMGKVEDPSL